MKRIALITLAAAFFVSCAQNSDLPVISPSASPAATLMPAEDRELNLKLPLDADEIFYIPSDVIKTLDERYSSKTVREYEDFKNYMLDVDDGGWIEKVPLNGYAFRSVDELLEFAKLLGFDSVSFPTFTEDQTEDIILICVDSSLRSIHVRSSFGSQFLYSVRHDKPLGFKRLSGTDSDNRYNTVAFLADRAYGADILLGESMGRNYLFYIDDGLCVFADTHCIGADTALNMFGNIKEMKLTDNDVEESILFTREFTNLDSHADLRQEKAGLYCIKAEDEKLIEPIRIQGFVDAFGPVICENDTIWRDILPLESFDIDGRIELPDINDFQTLSDLVKQKISVAVPACVPNNAELVSCQVDTGLKAYSLQYVLPDGSNLNFKAVAPSDINYLHGKEYCYIDYIACNDTQYGVATLESSGSEKFDLDEVQTGTRKRQAAWREGNILFIIQYQTDKGITIADELLLYTDLKFIEFTPEN